MHVDQQDVQTEGDEMLLQLGQRLVPQPPPLQLKIWENSKLLFSSYSQVRVRERGFFVSSCRSRSPDFVETM